MANLIIIVGPQAVGKMTVGQELSKITNLKFMHNHDTLELPARIFGWENPVRYKLTELFRESIFKEVAKSNLEGLIFTLVWNFNEKQDWDWIEKLKEIFEKEKGKIYIVELETSIEERLKRNKTANRLANKPSKKDIEYSEKEILLSQTNGQRLNSNPGEVEKVYKNYLRINNTNISAKDAAKIIKEKFYDSRDFKDKKME